jgi:hypothetical protein
VLEFIAFFTNDRAEAKEQSCISLCPVTGLATALESVSTGALSSAYKQKDCIMGAQDYDDSID